MRDEFRGAEGRHRHVQAQAHRMLYPGIGEVWWLVAAIFAVVFVAGPAYALIGFLSGDDVAPAFGPGRIAFHSDRDGDDEIYVMNADGSGVQQLTYNDSHDRSPTWSPDGRRLLFSSDRGNDVEMHHIYVMNADGSGVEQITDGCSSGSPAWSPDGDRIAFGSGGGIHVMDADGSGVQKLTGDASASCGGIFWADRDGDGRNELYTRNADGSVELFTDWSSLDLHTTDWSPSWSPDGSRIVFASDRGNHAFVHDIYVMDADGGGVARLTHDENINRSPTWSPDGGRIAFSSNRDGDHEIYLMNTDGSGVQQLTENEYDDYLPRWSPDGGRIAFSSDRDGDLGIYVMYADGSGVVRIADGFLPAWSPATD